MHASTVGSVLAGTNRTVTNLAHSGYAYRDRLNRTLCEKGELSSSRTSQISYEVFQTCWLSMTSWIYDINRRLELVQRCNILNTKQWYIPESRHRLIFSIHYRTFSSTFNTRQSLGCTVHFEDTALAVFRIGTVFPTIIFTFVYHFPLSDIIHILIFSLNGIYTLTKMNKTQNYFTELQTNHSIRIA